MLSRISFHVLYDRFLKTLCLLKYALMKRHDYDITVFSTKRVVTIMVSEPEIREEFCTSSGPSDSGGNPPPERLKKEYHSIRQTNTEISTEFMQRFLRLAGFLRAAAGTEDEQQVANAARNYEILHERDDDDAERPDNRQKSGDRHQPTTQQSSHRNHGHNNDRHGSDRRGGGDNHRSSNN
nr:zinc finger, CCHC-type, retrotransposon Gag domain protein [Tanacetum cinerariifolium]